MFEFEHDLQAMLRDAGREVVEATVRAAEPPDRPLPKRVRRGRDEYRRNRRTRKTIATLFGDIRFERSIYQAVERGDRSLAPLDHQLGLVAGVASPALADEAARLSADLPQAATRAVLTRRHAIQWRDGTLRRVVAAMAEHYGPHRHDAQVARLVELLATAKKIRGSHPPTLAVGRDGVMVPMRPCWEEASAATLSVLDRGGKRLGTVYLGRMPESGQGTMTKQLERLIVDVLRESPGAPPRLQYITDAGNHPQEFYRERLQSMKHPRTNEPLDWQWTVDFYHAAERLTKIGEALYGESPQAAEWARRARRTLRDERRGVYRVIQQAQALRRLQGLRGSAKAFREAYRYLRKYASHMDYASLRARKLTIGSGVTEAACKTIVNARLKQSGMRWKRAQGQNILDLRVILKSAVWDSCRNAWLTSYISLDPVLPAQTSNGTRRITGKQVRLA